MKMLVTRVPRSRSARHARRPVQLLLLALAGGGATVAACTSNTDAIVLGGDGGFDFDGALPSFDGGFPFDAAILVGLDATLDAGVDARVTPVPDDGGSNGGDDASKPPADA